jgi:N-methylhydantoinase B
VSRGTEAIDSAAVEIIRNYLGSTVEQMRRTLVRTAFNPVIYEVLDFGISMYDAHLRLMAEAPGITSFLGANDSAIIKGVEYVGAEKLDRGDIVMLNYPYWNSAHTYDALLFAPVFYQHDQHDDRPTAYLCVRAHWMDPGAKDPGYVLDSTEMHQEGLILPGTKIVKKGRIDREILELIRFNSRLPDLVTGDFHAQVAAIRVGEQRLLEIYDKFGRRTVMQAVEEILDRGERLARQAVSALPDGSWTAFDWLDDDGVTDDMIRMEVKVTIDGDQFYVDWSGSDGKVAGPVNMPFGATQSFTKVVFKGLTTPQEPANAGHYRNLHVSAPPGNLFHAVYPSPTFTLWTEMVAFELIHKALAQGLSTIAASSGGDEPGFMALGTLPNGEPFVISNNEGVGWGAAPTHDGSNALQHLSTSVVRNTPIEVLEHKATLLHERMELRTDSGGAGRYRGGLGIRRDVRFTADGEVLSMKKKTKTRPWALAGGLEAETNGMIVYPGTPKERRIGMRRAPMKAGERFFNFSAGGGGYGNPLEREPQRVAGDVLDGYVSPEAARETYGVIVHADGRWELAPNRKS